MGLFSGAKAQIAGQKALRTHISANQMANEGKREAARAKYAEAYRLYEQAMKEGSLAPNVHQGFAVLLLRLGEFEKAHDLMQDMRTLKAMTEDDWFDLRLNYSIYLWRTGSLDDAIDTIRRAAKIKMNASIYTTLGMYLIDRARLTGDFSEVKALNDAAMDYDDEDAGILDNLGATYEAMMEKVREAGDEAQARAYRASAEECYVKAHTAKPRQITTIYALAKLRHEDGDDAAARELLSNTDDLYYHAICPVSEAMMEALKREIG